MEKMTYVKALDVVLASADVSAEVSEKLTALRAQLVKRASAPKSDKPTKAQREAQEFTDLVFHTLNLHGEPVKCGDLAKELDVSGQKVSAALSKLYKAGLVGKTVEKGVTLFAVAGPDME